MPTERNVEGGKEYFGPTRYRVRTKNGNYKWVEMESYSFYYDAQKKARRNVGIVKEIDEQVRTEDELRQALAREIGLNKQIKQREELYSFALKVGGLGVYDWYVKEDRAAFSPRFYEILGYKRDELKLTFLQWLALVHPDDHFHFTWHNFKEREAQQPNTRHIYRVKKKSGDYMWVEAQNMAVERDEKNHVVRMIGVIKDIDLEKRSADLLHQTFEEQKKLNTELKKREAELTDSHARLISQMTVLKKLNKELHDSDNRWEYALQSNGDGVIEWIIATNECYFSDRAKEILDFPLNDKNDYQKFMDFVHPQGRAEFNYHLEQCLKNPTENFSLEVQVMNHQGNYRWIMFRGKVLELDEKGNPYKMMGTVTDLSAHKVLQKELTIYEEMIKQNQSAILFTSINGGIQFANNIAAELFHYKQHEIIEQNISLLLPEHWQGRLLYDNFRGVQDFITKSNQKITTQVVTSLIRQDDEAIGFVLNIMDITERKRLEDKVSALTMAKLTSELEIQQQQKQMIINVQEQEKEYIARELHDGVGQWLSLIKLQMEQLEGELPEATHQKCKNLVDMIQQVSTDIKNLTNDLMPLSIRNLGLESGMATLLERYKAVLGKKISFTCKIQLGGFEPNQNVSTHIYRIAQEAVSNSIKYSNADAISLILVKLKNSINLMIEDNGKGFVIEDQATKKNSYGLKTMMERAKLINGKLLINSSLDAGTTISVTIPIN